MSKLFSGYLKALIPTLALLLMAPIASGQRMSRPQQNQQNGSLLTSSDVTAKELNQVAEITMATRVAVQGKRGKIMSDLKDKYGSMSKMDSTQKSQAQLELEERRQDLRGKMKKIFKEKANARAISTDRVIQILKSARHDSTLRSRLQSAMKAAPQAKELDSRNEGMGGGQSRKKSEGRKPAELDTTSEVTKKPDTTSRSTEKPDTTSQMTGKPDTTSER